jgi:CheY-like chemotaxis protein
MSPPLPALVADDSAVARAALVRALKGRGAQCVEASSAALAKGVDPGEIACALLDLDLGDGTGVDVARALLSLRPDLPIAFFSAGAPDGVLEEAQALARVFRKPEELEAVLAWAMERLGAQSM